MEIVFGFLIAAILLGLTATNLKVSVQQEGPRGLAYTLASDLRAARSEAQRSGKMVAVCFPSEGRTNSLSRSAVVRRGDQRGHIYRLLNYGNEYDATIFLGSWPGATNTSTDVPIGWSISTSDSVAIYFRADGTAFSNELPSVDGNYPLVVGSSFRGSLNGPGGTISHAKNPHTVWVSGTGSITVDERRLPSGTLPEGESELTVADLDLANEPPPAAPTVIFTKFLPEQVEGLNTASVGQNYLSIHPNQKEGAYLEYGVATIEVKARDRDGGPLSYTLEATASSGESGEFTVSDLQGQMRYVFDPVENDHVWHALVSWRPPPGAPADLTYELTMTIVDPEGHSAEISSAAGLLPRVSSLPPSRMVMCSESKDLYLTNLDGSNEIHISKDGGEINPFFSADGSRIFSFFDHATGIRELRSRPSDGSVSYDQLASFDNTAGTEVYFDPTFTYAALVASDGVEVYNWVRIVVETETDSDGNTTTTYRLVPGQSTPTKYKILIVNLMSNDPPLTVTNRALPGFRWAPDPSTSRHTFAYNTREASPPENIGPHSEVQPPGWKASDSDSVKRLVGHPASVTSAAGFDGEAGGRIYNPAQPSWYMEVSGSNLLMKNSAVPTFQKTLYTASAFEDVAEERRRPSWSADGERVAFVANPGSGSKVVSMRVLDSSLAALSSPVTGFELQAPHIKMAQLSPEGKWIYYLRNKRIYRAENTAGSGSVDISTHIDPRMASYVISP